MRKRYLCTPFFSPQECVSCKNIKSAFCFLHQEEECYIDKMLDCIAEVGIQEAHPSVPQALVEKFVLEERESRSGFIAKNGWLVVAQFPPMKILEDLLKELHEEVFFAEAEVGEEFDFDFVFDCGDKTGIKRYEPQYTSMNITGFYVTEHITFEAYFGANQVFKVGHTSDLRRHLHDNTFQTCFCTPSNLWESSKQKL